MAEVPKNLTAIIEKIKKNEALEENRTKEVNEILSETSKLREENARLSDLLLEKEMEREELLTKAAVNKEIQNFKQLEKKLVAEARQKWIKMTEEYEDEKEKEVEERWNKQKAHIASLKSKVTEIKSRKVDEEESRMFEQLLLGTLGKPPELKVVEPTRSPLGSPLIGEKPNNNKSQNFEIEEEFIDFEIMQQLENLTDSWPSQRAEEPSKQNQPNTSSQKIYKPPQNPQYGTKNSKFNLNQPKISTQKSNFSFKSTQKFNKTPINFSQNKTQNIESNTFKPKSLNFKNKEIQNSSSKFEYKKPEKSLSHFQPIQPVKSTDIRSARDVYQEQNPTRTSSFEFKKPLPKNPKVPKPSKQFTLQQNQEDDYELMDSEDYFTAIESSYTKTMNSSSYTNPVDSNPKNPSNFYVKSVEKKSNSILCIDLESSNSTDFNESKNNTSASNPSKFYQNPNQMKPSQTYPEFKKYLMEYSKNPSNSYKDSFDEMDSNLLLNSELAQIPSNFNHSQDSAFYSASPNKFLNTSDFDDVSPKKSKFVPKQATFSHSK